MAKIWLLGIFDTHFCALGRFKIMGGAILQGGLRGCSPNLYGVLGGLACCAAKPGHACGLV